MIKSLARTLTNTNSRFWRIYELVSSAVFFVLLSCVMVFLIGEKLELLWTAKVLILSVVGIVICDVLKYKITGSSKDKPLRKWFSFRWAQRYRPEETLILPKDNTDDVKHLKYSRCNKCGVLHGFSGEEGKSERVCSFRGCKELVSSSDEYASSASEKFRIKKERVAVFAQVRLAPFRFLYRHSWTITEHTFKLFSWMLIACAVLAAGRHLKNDVIEYTGIFICVIWVINFVIVCLRAMTFIQDEMIEWSHNGEENRVIKLAISFSVSMVVAMFMLQLIPLSLKAFGEVYSNIKLF